MSNDGALDVSDAVRILLDLFTENVEIPDPGVSGCGFDPTPDVLGCEETSC